MGGGVTEDRKLRRRHAAKGVMRKQQIKDLRAQVAGLERQLADSGGALRDAWGRVTGDPLVRLSWLGRRVTGLRLFFTGRV